MKDFVKSRKGYSRKKRVTINLDEDLVDYLDQLAKNTGLDRSKIVNFALRGSENIYRKLLNQIELARTLGFRSPSKMKRALKRATEKAEKKTEQKG